MTTAVIACRTIETELNRAMELSGISYPVLWLDSGLHVYPKKLNGELEKILSETPYERLLFAMGYCGGGLSGLHAGEHELIIPKIDDCITLFLGSLSERRRIGKEYAAYFLTEGWLRGEQNIWTEYLYMVSKYGEETAAELSEEMYGNYRTLALLDTGTEPMEPLIEKTKIIADTLSLRQQVLPASLSYISALLTGPWDDGRFIKKAPHSVVTCEELCL